MFTREEAGGVGVGIGEPPGGSGGGGVNATSIDLGSIIISQSVPFGKLVCVAHTIRASQRSRSIDPLRAQNNARNQILSPKL